MRDLASAHGRRETWSGLWFSVAQSSDENLDGHHGPLTWTGARDGGGLARLECDKRQPHEEATPRLNCEP
jgi:hypothetical protein